MNTTIRVTLLLGALSFLAPRAQAQYFGRNPVQYENFHFKVLKTQHFDVYFYDKEAVAAAEAARMAERWYARISTVLRHQLSGRQPLILYADHPDFEQTNVLGQQPGEGTGGVTESLKRRIILPMGASLAETDHVIGHELTHAFQYDITGVGRGSMATGLNRVPLWFIEGMAEYVSLGNVDPNTRSEEHTSELQSRLHLVCRLLLEKKKTDGNDVVVISELAHVRTMPTITSLDGLHM